jgi:transcription elongation factor GreB
MGRYRPPEPAKAAIITAEGFARLQEELNYLWKVKRPEVTARVAAAACLGGSLGECRLHLRQAPVR